MFQHSCACANTSLTALVCEGDTAPYTLWRWHKCAETCRGSNLMIVLYSTVHFEGKYRHMTITHLGCGRKITSLSIIWKATITSMLWPQPLPCFGNNHFHTLATITSMLWQQSLPCFGNNHFHALATITSTLWQQSLPCFGNNHFHTLATTTSMLWQQSLPHFGHNHFRGLATASNTLRYLLSTPKRFWHITHTTEYNIFQLSLILHHTKQRKSHV